MPIREQQTTNKQHAIPQSIMSVEFKIIGDLTLKQFFFLLIFCGLAYTSFMTIQAFVFKWLLVLFFVGLGLCFAFLPLGDRGLDVWIVNFLRAMLLPNQFVYRKQEEIPSVFLYQNLDVLRSELITLTPTSSRRKIEAYLEQQEAPFDKLDIDEKGYILKVKEAYSSGYAGFSSSSVSTTVVEDLPSSKVTESPIVGPPIGTTNPDTNSPPKQNLAELELPAPREWQPQPVTSVVPIAIIPITAKAAPIKQTEIIRRTSAVRHQDDYYSPTMTPDMHVGRRFINLATNAGGEEIVLPIRGERVLKSLESNQFDAVEAKKEEQKVQQLDNLINQIKNKEVLQKQIIESQKIAEAEEVEKRLLEEETRKTRQQEIIRIEEENKHLQEQARLETENQTAQEARRLAEAKMREQAMREQERLQRLRDQEKHLRQQKEEVIRKHAQELQVPAKPQPQSIPLKPIVPRESPTAANVVWGTVTTGHQGGKVPVPGVVVVIRNQRNEVVRAVKTNAQGRFGITTPLIDGTYTVEVDREKKSGLTFAATTFEARGELLPTMEVLGKA